MFRIALVRITKSPVGLVAALLGGWGLVSSPLAAQDTIVTDRPGLLFAASTVGAGVWQLEAGVPLYRDESGGAESRSENLVVALRRGIGDHLELRLGTSATRVDSGGAGEDEVTGVGDLELGLKWLVRDGAGGGPAVVLIPSVILPTGDDELSAGDPVGTLNVVASFALGGGWGATALAGLRGGASDAESFIDVSVAGLLGHGLPWVGWSGYAEAGWTEPDQGDGIGVAGAGVAYVVTDYVQLDLSVGHGITSAATDWRWEIGASVRF